MASSPIKFSAQIRQSAEKTRSIVASRENVVRKTLFYGYYVQSTQLLNAAPQRLPQRERSPFTKTLGSDR